MKLFLLKRLKSFFSDPSVDEMRKSREEEDKAIFAAFTSDPGKRALDYLIAEHYAFVTPTSLLKQTEFDNGRRFVVQDILDSMERFKLGAKEETVVETEEEVNA